MSDDIRDAGPGCMPAERFNPDEHYKIKVRRTPMEDPDDGFYDVASARNEISELRNLIQELRSVINKTQRASVTQNYHTREEIKDLRAMVIELIAKQLELNPDAFEEFTDNGYRLNGVFNSKYPRIKCFLEERVLLPDKD